VDDQKVKTLAAVTVGPGKTDAEKLDERYASGCSAAVMPILSTWSTIRWPAMMDIFHYLQGKVAGLQITPGQGPGRRPAELAGW
jgi:hypothetical protein